MVIYIDLLFFQNFLISFIFLYLIDFIYKDKIKIIKIIIASSISGFIVIISLYDYYLYYLFKVSGGLIISMIGLKKSSGVKMMVKNTSFYMVNFASVGFVSIFNINTYVLLICSVMAIIVFFVIESNKNEFIFTNKLKYNISVTFKNINLDLEGFLDTGNFSTHKNLPIIYLDNKYYSNILDEVRFESILINTINGSTYIKIYKPTKCIIEIGNKKINFEVYIAFSNLNEFDCLLNAKLLI